MIRDTKIYCIYFFLNKVERNKMKQFAYDNIVLRYIKYVIVKIYCIIAIVEGNSHTRIVRCNIMSYIYLYILCLQ